MPTASVHDCAVGTLDCALANNGRSAASVVVDVDIDDVSTADDARADAEITAMHLDRAFAAAHRLRLRVSGVLICGGGFLTAVTALQLVLDRLAQIDLGPSWVYSALSPFGYFALLLAVRPTDVRCVFGTIEFEIVLLLLIIGIAFGSATCVALRIPPYDDLTIATEPLTDAERLVVVVAIVGFGVLWLVACGCLLACLRLRPQSTRPRLLRALWEGRAAFCKEDFPRLGWLLALPGMPISGGVAFHLADKDCFALPAPRASSRFWRVLRCANVASAVYILLVGAALYIWSAAARPHADHAHPGVVFSHEMYGWFALFLASGALSLLFNVDRRRRTCAALARLGRRGETMQAAAIAALVLRSTSRGRIGRARAMRLAADKFRVIRLDRLCESDLAAAGQNLADARLAERTEACELHKCDAFLSHSWRDAGSAKFHSLLAWAATFKAKHAGREPTLWLDKCAAPGPFRTPAPHPCATPLLYTSGPHPCSSPLLHTSPLVYTLLGGATCPWATRPRRASPYPAAPLSDHPRPSEVARSSLTFEGLASTSHRLTSRSRASQSSSLDAAPCSYWQARPTRRACGASSSSTRSHAWAADPIESR